MSAKDVLFMIMFIAPFVVFAVVAKYMGEWVGILFLCGVMWGGLIERVAKA